MTDFGLNACRLHLQRCSGRMPTTSTGKQNDSNGKGKHGKVSFGKMSAKSGEIEKAECRKPCFGLCPTACFLREQHTDKYQYTPFAHEKDG